jgi:hypothetical protein
MPASRAGPQLVRFGKFALDLRSGELSKNGRRHLLPVQPFRILALLVRSPGTLVTRDDLRRELWRDDTFVDFEHSLNAAIKRLRQALGDPVAAPRLTAQIVREDEEDVGRGRCVVRLRETGPTAEAIAESAVTSRNSRRVTLRRMRRC